MTNVETRKEMAARLRERTQEIYPDYRVDYWVMECSDALGVSLSNDKEYISTGVYKASILDEEQLLMAIKLKLDNKMYDSHTIYHKNIKLIDEIVDRYDLGNYIGYTDTLYVMPNSEDYDDAPFEFGVDTNSQLEVVEGKIDICILLDEGVVVINKETKNIQAFLTR